MSYGALAGRLSGRVRHPDFPGEPLNYEALAVSDSPDEQVEATIRLMHHYVAEDYRTPEIQRDAAEARELAWLNHGGDEVAGVWHYVKGRLRFVTDDALVGPLNAVGGAGAPVIEILIRPVDMSRGGGRYESRAYEGRAYEGRAYERRGDCDDWSMYTAALLRALGHDYRFVTAAAEPDDPGRFSHVYVAAYENGHNGHAAGTRVALDTSHGKYPGWEVGVDAGQVTRVQEWMRPGADLGWLLWAGISAWAAWRLVKKVGNNL